MEALAAVGLVGNIVQFIDFSGKLISKADQLYHSKEGALVENIDIEVTTNDIRLLCDKFTGPQTSDNVALERLCKSCNDVATTLLEKLDAMKVKSERKQWESMKKAVRNIWNKEDIAHLERRLARFRDELNFNIVVDLR
jgi:hypothetical protein